MYIFLSKMSDVPYAVRFEWIMVVQHYVENITGTILGIGMYALTLWISVVTVLDLIYLTNPAVRDIYAKRNWDGGLKVIAKGLISKDAVNSYVKASTIETGKSVLATYMLARLKTIVISVAFLMITVNGTSLLIRLVLKLISGALDVFNIV